MSQKKQTPCRNGCGKDIYFDDTKKSQSGKPIPLEAGTGQPHNCPRSPYNMKRQETAASPALDGKTSAEYIAQVLEPKIKSLEDRVNTLELKQWRE